MLSYLSVLVKVEESSLSREEEALLDRLRREPVRTSL